VKQPWAALLVHGRKTIEVRRWSTARRGRILIHAARIPDPRPEAWEHVPPELLETARLTGGILGVGELTECLAYRSRQRFAADQARHLNDPCWFDGPVLYGLRFTNLTPLPFRPYSGWVKFFPVEDAESTPPALTPGLLVSVRSVAEAGAALAGGAALIDVKEPSRGSLGRADPATIAAVCDHVGGRCPVSAALGELVETPTGPDVPGLAFAKWGLSQCGPRPGWRKELTMIGELLRAGSPGCRLVAVAYADWRRAQSPPPEEVAAFARESPSRAFLLDTWQKDGSTLLDWITPAEVTHLSRACREAGVPVALAGSLGSQEILVLREAQPTWFAVRGAVCRGGRREAEIDPDAVGGLADLVANFTAVAPPAPTRRSGRGRKRRKQ
jgi:hypothetical protein